MLQTSSPVVCWMKSAVSSSMGSPVKDSFSKARGYWLALPQFFTMR